MMEQINAFRAELQKIRHLSIAWVTFAAFALAPVMGGLFMLILKNPDSAARSSMLRSKAETMSFTVDLSSYVEILAQAVGVGGVLIFGFVASWIFGREYTDGTAKDLLALPTSRTKILNAKFLCYVIWCLALVTANLLLGLLIGAALQLPGWDMNMLLERVKFYLITTLLTIPLGTPIAFFALWGRGYLAPLGFVAITLVLAQIIAATGVGNYFPWAIPGLYSGAGGEYRSQLNAISYTLLALTCLIGYVCTVSWWKYADQSK